MFEDNSDGPIYLDYAATTPVSERVADVVKHYMVEEFGNAGSRTHEWGLRAKKAVAEAREYLASTMNASPEELVFTSGATESNNLAILGLAEYGRETGRRHLVTSATEHKAVLEPMEHLAKHGFEVDFLRPDTSGRFTVDEIMSHVRNDTLLVSLMQVNNETGVTQPTEELAELLAESSTYFHVDASQGYAKYPEALNAPIDLISFSGHKIGAPKGVGGLLMRRRGWSSPPVRPLMFGGGQERGLRPGTLPVELIAGLSAAAREWEASRDVLIEGYRRQRREFLDKLGESCQFRLIPEGGLGVPNILALAILGMDSEAFIIGWRDRVGISSGSACTSASYTTSHVLQAMGLEDLASNVVRISFGSA